MARLGGAPGPRAAPERATDDTVLVIGVHRAELAFGDAVAAGLADRPLTVFRIPHGIRRATTAPGARFYSLAEHHEIYLQLAQQIGGRPRLLLDLHRGVDEAGRGADLFCHHAGFLRAVERRLRGGEPGGPVRLLRILDEHAPAEAAAGREFEAAAHTWIPRAVWAARRPLYVGLEIYLPAEGRGNRADWAFARGLVDLVCAAGDRAGDVA